MFVTILGSGHSGGTPMIGEGWGLANPENPKNRRTRSSILVENDTERLLIDTSPDLRAQLLAAGVERINAVLYTHSHADHLNGIDDLRSINRVMKDWIPTYTDAGTWREIETRFHYVLEPLKNKTNFFYKPCLERHEIKVGERFSIGTFNIGVMDQDHGFSRTLGFRINNLAYSTDVVELPEESFEMLKGVDTWIVGALWEEPHSTHAHVEKVLSWAERVKPRRLILTHLSHRIDYDNVSAKLPEFAKLAYDGMRVSV
ncbi:MAG: MBL fold metallo-hydrolase [Rhodospirillales bacterium]|jgi:phosphoribosyl 1,2-cyclic phosphate phosphodiesterase